jgi:hypothetical protein
MEDFLIDLCRFDEADKTGEGEAGGESGAKAGKAGEAGAGESNSGSGDANKNTGDNKGGEGSKGGEGTPFATFKDEETFMKRLNRAGKSARKEMLTEMGVESEEALKDIIKAKKAADDAAMTELEKAKEKVNEADKKAEAALTTANNRILSAEAKVLATDLGVKASKIKYLLKLADLSDVEVKDGEVDQEALKEAIEVVLTDMPELKGTTEAGGEKPATSTKGGSDFKGGDTKLLSHEIIKNMTSKQIAERITDVRAFLKDNPMK